MNTSKIKYDIEKYFIAYEPMDPELMKFIGKKIVPMLEKASKDKGVQTDDQLKYKTISLMLQYVLHGEKFQHEVKNLDDATKTKYAQALMGNLPKAYNKEVENAVYEVASEDLLKMAKQAHEEDKSYILDGKKLGVVTTGGFRRRAELVCGLVEVAWNDKRNESEDEKQREAIKNIAFYTQNWDEYKHEKNPENVVTARQLEEMSDAEPDFKSPNPITFGDPNAPIKTQEDTPSENE